MPFDWLYAFFEIANFEDSVRHFEGIRRAGILPFLWAVVDSVCKLSGRVESARGIVRAVSVDYKLANQTDEYTQRSLLNECKHCDESFNLLVWHCKEHDRPD